MSSSLSKAASLNVNESRFNPELGDGSKSGGSGKKKDKRGFKSDRYAKYKAQFDKVARKKLKEEEKKKGQAVKEIKFDAEAREEWLTTRHKEKNQRKVNARVEQQKKERRENSKFKKSQREEARQQYNSYARVPILPDFSYKVPRYVDGAGRPIGEADEDDGDDCEACDAIEGSTFFEDQDAVMGEGVRVDVRPLITPACKPSARVPKTNPITGKRIGPRGGGLDFSDLPPAVAAELEALQKANPKGEAQPKRKVHMLKEMAKINKIQKTQRKGHGKKNKSAGKRSHK